MQLWMPFSEALQHDKPVNNAGKLVTGESEANPPLERWELPDGSYFYFPTGAGPTADEIMSGAPLSPERLREIEVSAKEAAKDRMIKRMTFFLPKE